MLIPYLIHKIWHPDWFQGSLKRNNYFEGWYFKLVNPDTTASYAVIPGISIGREIRNAYSFIQFINGKTGESHFLKYGIDEFRYSKKEFEISIAGNRFSTRGISLNIKEPDLSISGDISFKNLHPYPVKFLSPGVMGWYRFVPTMECYHGILSMLHTLEGSLNISGTDIDFSGGKGYTEKDWGKSMPLSWIWIQSNHFERKDLSLSLSIANIPWRRTAFTGFLIIISTKDNIYRFTTYTGAKIKNLTANQDELSIEVENKQYILKVNSRGSKKGKLKAPVKGEMSRNIYESIGATVHISMSDRKGNIMFSGSSDPSGLEVSGDVNLLKLK